MIELGTTVDEGNTELGTMVYVGTGGREGIINLGTAVRVQEGIFVKGLHKSVQVIYGVENAFCSNKLNY